jgi:hypothetical protein
VPIQVDGSILVAGKFVLNDVSVGLGLMLANVYALGGRYFHKAPWVQSVDDGGNALVFLHLGYGGLE